MNTEDRDPVSLLFQEERHRVAHERAEAAPTMAATDERLMTRTKFSFRIKPDRRRLVIPVEPTTERRGRIRNGEQ